MTTRKKTAFLWGALALVAVLIVYNYWSFKNGRCTISTLTSLSPAALILVGCNLMAGFTLFFLKIRHHRKLTIGSCRCGQQITDNSWTYCPQCGRATGHHNAHGR